MVLYPKDLQPWFHDVDLLAEGLVDVKEAASFLAISRTKVYEYMAEHELPSVKIGKARRIPKVALKIFAVKGG
jgi:excisionase family DNA binding protein